MSHFRLLPESGRASLHTIGGMILRCTAKMLKLLGARPGDLVPVKHNDQDWYANLLWLDGRNCLLLAHAGTLFSVFVPESMRPIWYRSDRRSRLSFTGSLRPRASRWTASAFSMPAQSCWLKQRAGLCWAT